jgi:hypothetical protein
MAMLAPVHVEKFRRLFGSNPPISAHFTAFNSSDQLQRMRSSIVQETLKQPGGYTGVVVGSAEVRKAQ